MKTLLIISMALVSLTVCGQSQKKSVVIGSKTDRPNALLIVNPQNSDQGVLLPQLSTGQRMSIRPNSPQENGLIVYDTDRKAYYYWSDGNWIRLNGGGTGFHTVDPASFKELKGNEMRYTNAIMFEADNAFVTVSRAQYGESIIAPLALPHGARLDEITLYYMDNDNDNLTVSVLRKNMTGGAQEILRWDSSGASSSIRNQTFTTFNGLEEIDLEHYSYRIVVRFALDNGEHVRTPAEARQRIYGLKIKYQE